jgi:type III secretion system YscQ/HrcQ family protein
MELHQYLNHVTADELNLAQQLFASPRIVRVSAGDGSDSFRIVGVADWGDGEFVELRGHQQPMQISVTGHHGQDRLGDRVWSDFHGESRLLAWSLGYERLIENLQLIFEQPLLPERIGNLRATAKNCSDALGVGFTMSGDADVVSIAGVMRVPMSWAKRLLVSSSKVPAGSPRERFGDLPIGMSAQIPGPRLPVQRLRTVRPGDTIVLGSSAAAFSRIELRRGGVTGFRAAYRSAGLQITSRAYSDYQTVPEENDVNISKIDSTESTMSDESVSVPIALDFEIGKLTMTLDEASELQPGYIFAMPEPAAGTNVRIRANGTVIGHGELLVVGETLGVCVTRWSDNGLQ